MLLAAYRVNALSNIKLTPRSVYSTHEHSAAFPTSPLPLDITLELLFSILLLSTGIVLASPQLKPIQWSQWAGKISREGQKREGKYTREGEEILGDGDPYAFLGLDGGIGLQNEKDGVPARKGEGRRGFWDVRGKRKEYAEWARGGGKS